MEPKDSFPDGCSPVGENSKVLSDAGKPKDNFSQEKYDDVCEKIWLLGLSCC